MTTLNYALKKEWYNILLLVLPFVIIPFIWDQLPSQIPIRWNFEGEIVDHGSKIFGVLFPPLLNLGIYLILLYLPKIDPKKRIEIDQKPVPALRTVTVIMILGIHFWITAYAMGFQITAQNWLLPLLAVFFLVMGNYLRTLEPNYFIGIRVPWTLEDASNWKKTHRLGSYVWVGGGLLLLALFPLLSPSAYGVAFGITAGLMALIPTGYSFYLYKRGNNDELPAKGTGKG